MSRINSTRLCISSSSCIMNALVLSLVPVNMVELIKYLVLFELNEMAEYVFD